MAMAAMAGHGMHMSQHGMMIPHDDNAAFMTGHGMLYYLHLCNAIIIMLCWY
jgi:hypothetical protein